MTRKTMTTRIATAILAAAIAGIALSPAAAQEPGSRQTREFVEAAGQSDQFEILESRAVLAQTTDPQVRAFAQQMIRDHGETSRMLQQAALRAGLKPPPMGIGGDQARMLGELQGLRGRELDAAYLRHQALAHRSALVVEQTYATRGDDPGIRQAAASATQRIVGHLAMADQMNAKPGGGEVR